MKKICLATALTVALLCHHHNSFADADRISLAVDAVGRMDLFNGSGEVYGAGPRASLAMESEPQSWGGLGGMLTVGGYVGLLQNPSNDEEHTDDDADIYIIKSFEVGGYMYRDFGLTKSSHFRLRPAVVLGYFAGGDSVTLMGARLRAELATRGAKARLALFADGGAEIELTSLDAKGRGTAVSLIVGVAFEHDLYRRPPSN